MSRSGALAPGLLEEALAIAGTGCWVRESGSDALQVSPHFHRLLGYAEDLSDELVAWLALAHDDDRGALYDLLTAPAGAHKKPQPVRLRRADGLWCWFDVRSGRSPDGRIILSFSDCTHQRQIEAAARDSQLRYRALYKTAPLAFVLWDRHGHITEWNRQAETLFGWSAEQVVGKRVHRLLLPPECHAPFSDSIKSLLHHNGNGLFSGPAIARSGLRLYCNWYSVTLRNPAGQLLGILSLVLDQTEEQLARMRIEKSETTYRTLVETSPDAILQLALGGNILTANQQACRLFGLDNLDDLSAINLRQLLPAGEEADPLRALLDNPDESAGFIANRDLRLHSTGGLQFAASTAYTTISDSRGRAAGIVLFIRDITEKLRGERELESHRRNLEALVHERTQALQTARDSLAQIIDGSPLPAFVLDHTHRITHWNKACEQVIGLGAEAMIGTCDPWRAFHETPQPTLADLLIDDSVDSAVYRPSTLIAGGYEHECHVPHHDRWLLVTAAPLRCAKGRVCGAIQTMVDITESKHAEATLREASDRAESAAAAKAEFLANMSHEIRTPMNAVLGLTHLLQRTGLDSKQREFVGHIQDAGQMLLGLINNTLDLSKIEAGQMTLDSEKFQIAQLLANVNSVVLDQARQKSLALNYTVDPLIPQILRGDLLRLSQILINLLGNAIKFTPSGRIDVEVAQRSHTGDAIRLAIAVRDTGIGMTASQQERLFHAFSQADSSITRKYGGSGLGLSICQRLVKLMGGEIAVSSQPGQGSCFSFEINLEAPGEQNAANGQGAGSNNAGILAGKRVLLVEDIPTNQLVAGEMLSELGLNVVTVDNGREALDEMARNGLRYDIILMDIQMPEMDGLEATRRLRGGLALPELPIVAMTAHALDEERERCLAAGMNDFISKPIDPDTLRQVLLRQFPGSNKGNGTERSTERAAELPDLPGIDTREGMRRVMQKAALYERILRDFHSRFSDEANVIRQALASGDMATAERKAHNIKGLAGTIGANHLQDCAKALENALRGTTGFEGELSAFATALQEVIEGLARHFAADQPA